MLKDVAPTKTVTPLSYLSRAATQGTNYTAVVVWLLHCAFRGRVRTLITALGFSGLYLAAQAAGIYCIYAYARMLETGGVSKVRYIGLSVEARTDLRLLWAVVILAGLFFMASATFHFLSRLLILNLVQQRYALSLEQLVQQAGRMPDSRAGVASRIFMNYGLSKIIGGCRFGYVTSVTFFNAISGILGGVGAVVFLFHIDAPLTLLILLTAAFGALFLYPLTLRAVGFAKAREKTQGAMHEEMRRASQSGAETSRTGDAFAAVSRAQFGVWRVNFEISFAIEIGKTLIFAAVIYYMANEMMAGRQNWAILIAYVGALRLVLVGCTQAIRAYASVSRFYPQIARYYLFSKDIQTIDNVHFGRVSAGDRLLLGALNNGEDVVATVGECLALATTDTVSELKFSLLHAKSKSATGPLCVSLFDLTDPPNSDAAILLLRSDQIETAGEDALRQAESTLADRVALIIYSNPSNASNIGASGEKRLLVIEDGEFRRLEPIGTPECEAALAEFGHRVRARRTHIDQEGEEDDVEDDE
jgi:hypothetical protein